MEFHGVSRFVVAVAVGAVLAGCTSDPEPIVTETPFPRATPAEAPSPSPSPTPSPTGEVTAEELHQVIGGDAARTDLAGAMETAIYFMEARPYLFKDFEFRYWEALSLPGCKFCDSTLELADEILEMAASSEGGLATVREASIEAVTDTESGDSYVSFKVDEEPISIRDAQGEVISDFDDRVYEVSVGLRHEDGAWRVFGVGVEEVGAVE